MRSTRWSVRSPISFNMSRIILKISGGTRSIGAALLVALVGAVKRSMMSNRARNGLKGG